MALLKETVQVMQKYNSHFKMFKKVIANMILCKTLYRPEKL